MTQLSTITGEFTDPAVEAAFQADRLTESRRHARSLFILSAFLNALFLFSDWRYWGSPHFWVAIPARVTVTLWSLACLSFCRHMVNFRAVERVCFAWALVTAVAVAFLVSSRSDIAIFVLVMLPLIFYLVVPTSFRGNAGGGLGCAALLLIGYLAPAPLSPTAPGMVLAVVVLHCGMWITIARTNRLQRQEWTASRMAQAARAALAANSETLERMFMSVPIPLLVTRPENGSVVRYNDAAARTFGADLSVSRLHIVGEGNASEASLRDRIDPTQQIDNFECRIRSHSGALHDVLVSSRPILIDGKNCNLSSIVDITDRKEAERHLARLAMTDALTGLANRSHFMTTLEQASRSARQSGARMAVALIDVDEFKRINDSAGHDAGDAVLCAVAQRLHHAVRRGDLAARMGGDEFAVLFANVNEKADLDALIASITRRLHQPLSHGTREINCRVSMGLALFDDEISDIEELMKHADIALYEAKNGGRGRACLFEPGLLDRWQQEAQMLERARQALSHAPPTPWYQPKVDLVTGRIVGFEALLRCVRSDGSLIMPSDIAAAFEHSELGRTITDQMVTKVLADCRAWQDEGIDIGHVAINIPGVELHDPSFPDRLFARMADAGVPATLIELEVTESVFLGRDAQVVERSLNRLSDAGLSIALDDFGTGYASLSHLKQFPINVIKIDRRFVRDLETDPDDAAIVRAVLNLAYSLGIRTVAEGVENELQLAYLRAGGCHVGQGFHFGAAVPPMQVASLVKAVAFGEGAGAA